jgi:hypothetical protein
MAVNCVELNKGRIKGTPSRMPGMESLVTGMESLVTGMESLVTGMESLFRRMESLVTGMESLLTFLPINFPVKFALNFFLDAKPADLTDFIAADRFGNLYICTAKTKKFLPPRRK